jgi:DNA-binding PadR family transcriptional regulator
VVDGRMRRYYRLTDAGAALLEREAARLQDNADAARQRLSRRPAPDVTGSPRLRLEVNAAAAAGH